MMTNAEYHAQEMDRHNRQIVALKSQPHAEKMEAMKEWRDCMEMAGHQYIRAAVQHILAGNYGHAPMHIAHRTASNKRMNVAASLGQMIAALDFGCPDDKARQAFNSLSKEDQKAVSAAILEEVEEWRSNREE